MNEQFSLNVHNRPIIDSLVPRMQIEQGFALMADVDEASSQMPGEEEWLAAIEAADDEHVEELIRGWDEAAGKFQATWQPLGGVIEQPLIRDAFGELYPAPLIAAYPLLPLRPYVKRILIKRTLQAYKIVLIVGQSVHPSLTQELIFNAGKAFLTLVEPPLDELDVAESGRKAKKQPRTPILFEMIVAGDRVDNTSNREALKQRVKRFNPRGRMFIAGSILDSSTNQVWSTRVPWMRHIRRYYRYALTHRHQSADTIRENMEKRRLSWDVVVFGALLAFVAMIGSRFGMGSLGLSDTGGLQAATDIFVPVVVICMVTSTSRLRVHASRHVNYATAGFIALNCGLHALATWPPGVGMLIYLAVISAVTWVFANMLGILMESE